MKPEQLVAYVDVDDTLVRSVGSKRIPIPEAVRHVRHLHEAGVTLFCWSAGGGDYSRRSAVELGIESLFTGFLPKPHILIDDHAPQEWPNLTVAHPMGLHSQTVEDHLRAIERREAR